MELLRNKPYHQLVESMDYLLSCYQLADSMTEKHCFGILLLVMSSLFKKILIFLKGSE